MIEPRQIRAARALLNWSQDDLAKASGIARSSIKNIENDITTARKDTIYDIQLAFENCGVEFLPGSGVRIKNETVTVFEGEDAFKNLLDDLYVTAKTGSDNEILILGLDEELTEKFDNVSLIKNYLEKIEKAGIKEKIITHEDSKRFINTATSYKAIPKEFFSQTPLHIYGHKVSFLFGNVNRKVVVIDNEQLADMLKKLFGFVWEKAKAFKN